VWGTTSLSTDPEAGTLICSAPDVRSEKTRSFRTFLFLLFIFLVVDAD
jgi:hypothetical protein